MPRLSESSLGVQGSLLVLSCSGSFALILPNVMILIESEVMILPRRRRLSYCQNLINCYSREMSLVVSPIYRIWATTWQNQPNECAPSKSQISLGIRPVWSESLLSAWRKFRSLATHWTHSEDSDQPGLTAHSEDSDQTGRKPRLIWVFAGCTLILYVLSCRGSFVRLNCI